MKKFALKIVNVFTKIFALFYSYNTNNRFKIFKSKFYTIWISKEFNSVGKSVTVNPPLTLLGGKYIEIGNNVNLGSRGVLTAWDEQNGNNFVPRIKIYDNVSIGEDFHISAINSIIIGNNVLMGKKITITDNSHGKNDYNSLDICPTSRVLFSKGPVIIDDNVWIGDKVTILPNVRIHRNSIIGANSVVTNDVPANSIFGGVPAKLIKEIKD